MTKVLVVEDDDDLRRLLGTHLAAHGMEVDAEGTSRAALDRARRSQPDAILLDLGLPDHDGLGVIDAIRRWSNVPIIVVSARHDEQDKLEAFDLGANDYVTKPFGLPELVARIRATIRWGVGGGRPLISTPHFELDLANFTAHRDGGEVHLTRLEWALARELCSRPDEVVTYRQLLRLVWNEDPRRVTEDVRIRLHLHGLRHKLEPDPTAPRYFLSVRGLGLRFTDGAEGRP